MNANETDTEIEWNNLSYEGKESVLEFIGITPGTVYARIAWENLPRSVRDTMLEFRTENFVQKRSTL